MNAAKTLLCMAAFCGIASGGRTDERVRTQTLPPQFQVWGTKVPDFVASLTLPNGVELVAPPKVDFGPEIPLTNENRAAGFLPYTYQPFSFMHPQLRPSAAQRAEPRIQGFASWGEYEPLALGVYAAVPVKNLRVQMGALASKEGATLPASCVDIRRVRFLPNLLSARQATLEPLLLDKPAAIDLPAASSAFLWVTIYVPDGTAPGIYRGTLKLEADGLSIREVPVTFRVFPFRLEKTDRLLSMLYGFGWQGANYITGNPANLEKELIDMREHGMNHLAYSQQRPIAAGNPQDGFTFDFDAQKPGSPVPPLSKVLETAMRVGLDKVYFTAIHGPEKYSKDHICGYEWKTPEADRWYSDLYRAWAVEARKRKWPPVIHNIADEPQLKNGTLQAARHLAELVKAADPENRTSAFLMGLCLGEDDLSAFDNTLDLYITFVGDGAYQKRLRESGRPFLFYNQANPNRPLECRQAYGHTLISTGARGHQQFCYRLVHNIKKQDPVRACYDALTPGATYTEPVWIFAYPGEDGLLPNPAFEGIREGVDDLQYWQTLQRHLDFAEQSADAEIRKFATEQRELFRAATAKFAPISEDGRYRGTGWMYFAGQEAYDLLRFNMAKTILKLREKAGVPTSPPAALAATATAARSGGQAKAPAPGGRVQAIEYAPSQLGKFWPAAQRSAVITPLTSAPVVDGLLEESCWREATEHGGDFLSLPEKRTLPAQQQTYFRLGMHGEVLYLAARLPDDRIADKKNASRPTTTQFNWGGDRFEIFLGDPNSTGTIYHVGVNLYGESIMVAGEYEPGNFKGDKQITPPKGMTIQTAMTAEGWQVEAAFPAALFNRQSITTTGAGWVFNLARGQKRTQQELLSSWSPLESRFNEMWLFGRAFMKLRPPLSLDWTEVAKTGGTSILVGHVRNSAAADWQGVLLAKADGVPVSRREFTVPPGVQTVYLPLIQETARGTLTIGIAGTPELELGGLKVSSREIKQFMPGVDPAARPEEPEAPGLLTGASMVAVAEPFNLRFRLPLPEIPGRSYAFTLSLTSEHGISPLFRESLSLTRVSGAILLYLDAPTGNYHLVLEGEGLRLMHPVTINRGIEE